MLIQKLVNKFPIHMKEHFENFGILKSSYSLLAIRLFYLQRKKGYRKCKK